MPPSNPDRAVAALLRAGVLGLVVGHLINRAAGRFPWAGTTAARASARLRAVAALPVVEVATALLFALAALAVRALLGTAGLPLPRRPPACCSRSSISSTTCCPTASSSRRSGSAPSSCSSRPSRRRTGTPCCRAGLGAVVLFAVFLVLALISPRGLGMGDVKLAGLIGLYLGWIGWAARSSWAPSRAS